MSTTVRTLNFLPEIFQTAPNKQFLSSTLDQVVQQPDLKKQQGYIGSKFGYGIKSTDHYIPEIDNVRNNYQLEPAVTFTEPLTKKVTDLLTYPGLLDALKLQGSVVDNNDTLFSNQFYSWDSFVDLDKLVNYSQYYWVPNGPEAVTVSTGTLFKKLDYTITSNTNSYIYTINESGETLTNTNPVIVLLRGGTYTFTINQSSKFWIQTKPGLTGIDLSNPTVSTREISGVENNGTNNGVITFNVPLSTGQDKWNFPGKFIIDLATTKRFEDIEGRLLSDIGGIDNFYDIEGKTLLFYGYKAGEFGNVVSLYDEDGFDQNDFESYVPSEINKHYYRISILRNDPDPEKYVVKLTEEGSLPDDTNLVIQYGNDYGNRKFVKSVYSEIFLIPPITAPITTLYYQDDTVSTKVGKIIIVDNPKYNFIDVNDILGRKQYTSPNGVPFTNGLKIQFLTDVIQSEYINSQYYVEGVGDSISLLPLQDFLVPEPFSEQINSPFDSDPYDSSGFGDTFAYPKIPDYITINRNSLSKNAWSRSNNWFHVDVLNYVVENVLECTNTKAALNNASARAKRPIIEFYPNLKLFKSGFTSKTNVTYVNFNITDAFTQVAGQSLSNFKPDGSSSVLFDGARIIFAGDRDINVRNKIFVVSLVKFANDIYTIVLTKASDGDVKYNDQTVVSQGETYTGKTVYFDGLNWHVGQFKEYINQPPLFDIFDKNGISLSDISYYPGTNFKGCTLFEYMPGTSSTLDPILGFALTYNYVGSIGDIVFRNTLNTDTFTYIANNTSSNSNVNIGYVHSYDKAGNLIRNLGWQTSAGNSIQYQTFNFTYTGSLSFATDIAVADSNTIAWPTVIVYVNNIRINKSKFTVATNKTTTVTLTDNIVVGTPVTIMMYSEQVSGLSYYSIPNNLDHNPFNNEITTINLGDIHGHYESICNNVSALTGSIYGSNNYRDLGNLVPYGTNIVQHSSPLLSAAAFLKDDSNNFFDALTFNANQYVSYKNLLIQTLSQIDIQYIVGIDNILDQVVTYIAQSSSGTTAFYWSDMLAYGNPTSTKTYNFNTANNNTIYPLNTIYDFKTANYKSVLVYLTRTVNNKPVKTQLVRNKDYLVSETLPALEIIIGLLPGDAVTIKEYATTYGNYIPSTPTKMGFYPAFTPSVITDNTYLTPATFIKGHDGSYTKLYGKFINGNLTDIRDQLLFEFEVRVYNNLKNHSAIPITYDEVVPGAFRDIGIDSQQYLEIYSTQFLNWVGNNRIDYTSQTYIPTNDKTWNYSQSSYKFNNSLITQGNWRGMFLWLYDTCNPDTAPWEMLGLVNKPGWWDTYYGPMPYTSDNLVMWTDISNGYVWNNNDPYINKNRIRKNLLKALPVDSTGKLVDTFVALVGNYDQESFKNKWKVGDIGPSEYAYLKSSTWPFDLMRIMALLKPAQYFALGINLDSYKYNTEFNQYLIDDRYRTSINNVSVYGTSDKTASHSYMNWIVDYNYHTGIQGSENIYKVFSNLNVQLSYRIAGFTDKSLVNFLVEKISASDTSTRLIIPDENYQLLLYTNQPTYHVRYSSVIVQKLENGYGVNGNSKDKLYFQSFLPNDIGSYDTITVNGDSAIVSKYYTSKVIKTPYGHVFPTLKTLLEFIRGYGLYFADQGMSIDSVENSIAVSWDQMLNEIVYWANSGWEVGSIVSVNPVANTLTISKPNLVVQSLLDSNRTGILNQNLIPINVKDLSVYREDNSLTISVLNGGDSISYINASLTNIEHVAVFDNVTSFNDLIFNLTTGLRTKRMMLNGLVTNNWNGTLNAPGFFINQDNTQTWQPNVKYNKGEIVKYKNDYWMANVTIIQPSDTFDFTQWSKTKYNTVKKGLLPNSSTRSAESDLYYNSNTRNFSNDADLLSFSLIGYRPRTYMSGANIDTNSEVNFYKGLISSKGTDNSINQLAGINLNDNTLNYSVHENWAIKTFEYGGILHQNHIDFTLDSSLLKANPSIVSLISGDGVDGALQQIPLNKIKNYGRNIYNTNILPTVNKDSYVEKYPSAGYVNLNDVYNYGYSLGDLNNKIGIYNVYRDDYLWVANVNNDWDVYTPVTINAQIISVVNNLNNTLNVIFNNSHGLLYKQNIGILNFNNKIDGYYTVTSVIDVTTISITKTLSVTDISFTGYGIAYLLQSQRVATSRDINGLPLNNSEFTSTNVWVDKSDKNDWAVYQKTINYDFENLNTGINGSQSFGDNVAYIPKFGYIVADSKLGKIYQYYRSPLGIYVLKKTIDGPRSNSDFGYSITYNEEYFLVSSLSLTGSGYSEIYIYKIPTSKQITGIVLEQVIQVGNSTDEHIASMALSGDGNVLWVGLPHYNAVEMYFREKNLHYNSIGLQLASATTVNSTHFTVSGNHLNAISEGQRVSFVASYTSVGTLATPMSGSVTSTQYAIDPYNAPYINQADGTSNWDRIGSYFYAHGDLTSTIGTGDTIAFSNSGSINTTLFTISHSQYINDVSDPNNGQTAFFVNEQFISTLTAAILPNTTIYKVNFSENTVYTIVTGIYNADANTTTFYTVEPIEHTATSGSVIYTASVKFTYIAIDAETASTPGDNFGTSIATNYDGTKLFVGAPNVGFGPNLTNVGAVFVYDRLVETWQLQVDITNPAEQHYVLILPYIPLPNGKVFLNGVLLADNEYIVFLNTITIATKVYAGDLITFSSSNVVLNAKLTSFENISDLRQGELFGHSISCNSNGSELLVGSPFHVNADGKEGAVFRFTNEGKSYGMITGYIAANLTDPTMIFVNGVRINLEDYAILQTSTTTSNTSIFVDLYHASKMPSHGSLTIDNLTASQDTLVYSSINKTTGEIQLGIVVVGATVANGNTVLSFIQPLSRTPFATPSSIVVTGMTPAGLNGTFTVTACDVTSVTFATPGGVANGNYLELTGGVISATPMSHAHSAGVVVIVPLGDAHNIADCINAKGLTNILAYASEDNRLHIRLKFVELAPATNKLSISVFNNIYLYQLGFIAYVKTQTITDPNEQMRTQFGYTVQFNENNSFVASAPVANRYIYTTFDNVSSDFHKDTVFDNNLTQFIDVEYEAGAVHMFDYIPCYEESITNTGQYVYSQSVNDTDLDYGSNTFYGTSLSFNNDVVMIGSPKSKSTGKVTVYQNSMPGNSNWKLYRQADTIVDINKVKKVQLYNNLTDENMVSLDYIDPLQGKLLGAVAENIDYTSSSDPASYNSTGFATGNNVWGKTKVGSIWFDITNTKFLNYHQNDITYNSTYWGKVFPGSSVTVYTWVESLNTPANYTDTITGVPYDYGKYTTELALDSNNNLVPKYYYWVRRTNVVYSLQGKTLSDNIIEQYIANPQSSGISYFAPLRPNVYAYYNTQDFVVGTETNTYLGFGVDNDNDGSSHVQYKLIRDGYKEDFLAGYVNTTSGYNTPVSLYEKLIDSLRGTDSSGAEVPDIRLPKLQAIGINIRPKQSLFINRLQALKNYLEYANSVIIQYPILESDNLTFLNQTDGSTYSTNLYWNSVYWWEKGYSSTTVVKYEVPAYHVLSTITAYQGLVVGVTKNSQGKREIYEYTNGDWLRIALEDGTLQFSETLWDYSISMTGFGENFFDTTLFDYYPNIETGYIIRALNEQIYVGPLLKYRNSSLILLFEYIQSENIESNNYLPWLNKTSFIDISYNVRELKPDPTYKPDNETLLKGYIEEAKPYHTVIKEFLSVYTANDTYTGNITDFGIPPKWDPTLGKYVSPQLTYNQYPSNSYEHTISDNIWLSSQYNDWIKNFGLSLYAKPKYVITYTTDYVSAIATYIPIQLAVGMPVTGIVTINNEDIAYTILDIDNNTISGLIRGLNGTSISDHLPNTGVIIDLPGVVLLNPARGYTDIPKVTAYIDTTKYPAPITPAILVARMSLDSVLSVDIMDPGTGYAITPEIIFEPSYSVTITINNIEFIDNVIEIPISSTDTVTLVTGDLLHIQSTTSGKKIIEDGYYYINVSVFNNTTYRVTLHTNHSNSMVKRYPLVFTSSTYVMSDYQLVVSMRAYAIANTDNKVVRNLNMGIKFDRTSYNKQVFAWVPGKYYNAPYLGLGSSSATPASSAMSNSLGTILATVTSGSGSGATFTIYSWNNDTFPYAATYYVKLSFGGRLYANSDTITITGTLLGGTHPANDCHIVVTGTNNGIITAFTYYGTPANKVKPISIQGLVMPVVSVAANDAGNAVVTLDYTTRALATPIINPAQIDNAHIYFYRTYAPYVYDDTLNNGAKIEVHRPQFNPHSLVNSYFIKILNQGSIYHDGDKIVIAGTSLGGATPTNDCTIYIDYADGNKITISHVRGTAVSSFQQLYTKVNEDSTVNVYYDVNAKSPVVYSDFVWTSNTTDYAYLPQPIVNEGAYNTSSIVAYAGQVWQCITSNNDNIFDPTKWYPLSEHDNALNALDRIAGYYVPDSTMPGNELQQLIDGITYPNTVYRGNDFAPEDVLPIDYILQDPPFYPVGLSVVSITYDGTQYMAVGNTLTETVLLTSNTNGTWNIKKLSDESLNATDIIYAYDRYLITTTNKISPMLTSNDGIEWVGSSTTLGYDEAPFDSEEFDINTLEVPEVPLYTALILNETRSVAFGLGMSVLVSNTGNWTWFVNYSNTSRLTNYFKDVIYVNNTNYTGYIGVGHGQDINGDFGTPLVSIKEVSRILLCTGVNFGEWNPVPTFGDSGLNGITSSSDLDIIVTVGDNAHIWYSINASYWIAGSVNNGPITDNLNGVAYGNGIFVIVGDNGTILISENGITWNQETSAYITTNNLLRVKFINGYFYATGENNSILSSTNGTQWTSLLNISTDEPYYTIKGADFLYGYGPEELVAGVVTDNLSMTVRTAPGANWDTDFSQNYWQYGTGFNMVKTTPTTLDANKSVSFSGTVLNPFQISVFVMRNTTSMGTRIYESITTNTLNPYTYTIDWIAQKITLNRTLPSGYKIMIEVYEVGNGVELARGNSNIIPLQINDSGNAYIVTEAEYQTIATTPLIYHNGTKLVYNTDYSIISTLDKRLVIQFNTGYDATTDYIAYSILGNSVTVSNSHQYAYSIPQTEIFTNIDVSGVLTLTNSLPSIDIWVTDPIGLESARALSHVVVELNGLRLQYGVDYTIDRTNHQVNLIWNNNYDIKHIVAVTTFNDTSRQHLQTISSTSVVSSGSGKISTITISSPTMIAPKANIKYTNPTRTWVTINGYRVDPSKLSFAQDGSNVLTISGITIIAGDVVTVTSMVSTASPNSNKFIISLDKANKTEIYTINYENTSWLVEDLYPTADTIYLNDVSKFTGSNTIKINNERIRFTTIDPVAKTLTGLTRGVQGTGFQTRMVHKNTFVYVIGTNKLDIQYNNQIFTTSISDIAQPLQLSTGDIANFLNP